MNLRVESETIDGFCGIHAYVPQLLKLDVEGAEEQVFAGALETIKKDLPHIVFEFGHGFAGGRIPSHFASLLAIGYTFFVIDVMFAHQRNAKLVTSKDVLVPIAPEEIFRTGLSGNILALHSSKAAPILARTKLLSFEKAERCLQYS